MIKIQLGPILLFVSADDNTWHCRVVYVFRNVAGTVPQLHYDDLAGSQTVTGTCIFTNGDDQVWAYEMPLKRTDQDQARSYSLVGQSPNTLIVPALGNTPHLAYASCCGFNDWRDKQKLEHDKKEPWGRWSDLKAKHDGKAFHLLLLGGDQVYTDSIWNSGSLKTWRDKLRVFQSKDTWDAGGTYDRQTRAAFMEIYQSNWNRAPVASVLASIPSIMMWDDHDICDGWGSHPDDVQAFPIMQGLFRVARDYFEALQLGQTPGTLKSENSIGPTEQFSHLKLFGSLAILVLDLRSRRRRDRVMLDAQGWECLFTDLTQKCMASGNATPRHLIVMSSVPVVYVSGPSDITGLFPWDPVNDPQDDLIDQWSDYRHAHEREIFIRGLLKFGQETKTRVTILSGDIHVASMAVIESKRDEDLGSNSRIINQLTCSGIVNVPPGRFALTAIHQMLQFPQKICRDVIGETVPLADGWPKVIAARNWLSLRPMDSPRGSLLAEWHVEGKDSCPPKTITAV